MHGPAYAPAELLARLVAFDTTSHKSNVPLIRFVEDYLAQHGIGSQLVPTRDGAKASLFATIGPPGVGGVALSGHTDVVPVEGQDWDSDPFTLISRDGRLLGELDGLERELAAATRDPRFDPPFATLQVTRIDGGTATNIVPSSCRFDLEVRALPGLDVAAIERRLRAFADAQLVAEMTARAPEARITIELMNEVPPFAALPASEAVALALQLTGQNETRAVSYATEAGLFQDAGTPAVVCGPGSIAQAHTANEWIAADELDRCMAFLSRLGDWAQG
jgi:acetylornithine deacetylase/succinyl-diaminopimelate desuccinylase-like protein